MYNNYMSIKFNEVRIISQMKTGNMTFESCNYNNTTNVRIEHCNPDTMEYTLNTYSNTLIIIGVRNPVDRNLSELFQNEFVDKFMVGEHDINDTYKCKDGYIYKKDSSDNKIDVYNEDDNDNIHLLMNTDPIIDLFLKKDTHYEMSGWFECCFELTNIKAFDKEVGYSLYTLPNNNTMLIYTVEKLDDNKDEICDKLGITNFKKKFVGALRWYKNTYANVKSAIAYKKEYLDRLLYNDVMRFFYSDGDIESFYSKYKLINT